MKIQFKINYWLIVTILLFSSCSSDDKYEPRPVQSELEERIVELFGSTASLILPLETNLSEIPSDPNNPITEAKVELGRFLFHETGLARNPNLDVSMNMYSCATCHHFDAGFQSGLKQGIGEGGQDFGIQGEQRHKDPAYPDGEIDVQPIRTPAVLNVAYQDVMLWNGRLGGTGTNAGTEANWTIGTPLENNNFGFQGVETQVIAGFVEHRLMIDEDYIVNTPYKDLFDVAFPNDLPEDRYSNLNAVFAIAAYERTILPNQSPFQQWLNGDDQAMTDSQTEGALLFFNEAKCFNCHSGPGLNSMTFHALGMNDLAGENITTVVSEGTKKGRGGFTGNPEDDYKFKTPQLYNLKDVAFFGHGGSFESVEDIVNYKNLGVPENQDVPANKISPLFEPLNLNDDQIIKLVDFLENALYDSNLVRYAPEQLPTGNCFPNADSMSTEDLGCD